MSAGLKKGKLKIHAEAHKPEDRKVDRIYVCYKDDESKQVFFFRLVNDVVNATRTTTTPSTEKEADIVKKPSTVMGTHRDPDHKEERSGTGPSVQSSGSGSSAQSEKTENFIQMTLYTTLTTGRLQPFELNRVNTGPDKNWTILYEFAVLPNEGELDEHRRFSSIDRNVFLEMADTFDMKALRSTKQLTNYMLLNMTAAYVTLQRKK